MAPAQPQASTESELGLARSALEKASLDLLFEELAYDEKCLQIHIQKVANYHVRLAHQRDEWLKKRLDRAKSAVTQWWESKVGGWFRVLSSCQSTILSWGEVLWVIPLSDFNPGPEVSVHCWPPPEKHDPATGVAMVQEVKLAVDRWVQSVQLRDCATYLHELLS